MTNKTVIFSSQQEEIFFNFQVVKKEYGQTGLVKKDGDKLETLSYRKQHKKLGILSRKKL